MRRKLVLTCVATCMLCMATGCVEDNNHNVADDSASAPDSNSTSESVKVDKRVEASTKQEADSPKKNLEV